MMQCVSVVAAAITGVCLLAACGCDGPKSIPVDDVAAGGAPTTADTDNNHLSGPIDELPFAASPEQTNSTAPQTDNLAHQKSARTDDPSSDVLLRQPQQLPDINVARLQEAGIHQISSKFLVLLTDRDPQTVQNLPDLADRFVDHLQQVCGPLRPEPNGADFRMVGCLIQDQERFLSCGLLPSSLAELQHGQHRGYQFWMHDQPTDYYRRHLMLHEIAHCYMCCDTGMSDVADPWFLEGVAEWLATHQGTGTEVRFGVLPEQLEDFRGWGRISAIRRRRLDGATQAVQHQSLPSLAEVQFPDHQLAQHDSRYAFWWALAWSHQQHPEDQAWWQKLCHSRGRSEFERLLADFDRATLTRRQTDWLLMAESLTEGFDIERSFPVHWSGDESPEQLEIHAAVSWQDTGWTAKAGDTLEITANGRCTLADVPAPWISEPHGITLDYNQGRPLGELLAVLVDRDNGWISRRLIVAEQTELTIPRAARLWLQINDSAASRANNSGSYTAHIRRK